MVIFIILRGEWCYLESYRWFINDPGIYGYGFQSRFLYLNMIFMIHKIDCASLFRFFRTDISPAQKTPSLFSVYFSTLIVTICVAFKKVRTSEARENSFSHPLKSARTPL